MATSDSESVEQGSSKRRNGVVEDPPQTDDDIPQSDEDENDEEEEEYEIEAILDSKRNVFGPNTIGYLVKWKGYESEHNSWVAEEDAGNAQELINQFWRDNKKKKSGKKEPVSSKARQSRQSTGGASTSTPRRKNGAVRSEDESASAPVPKKRGRGQRSNANEDDASEIVAESEDETSTAKKRKRGNASSARESSPPKEDDLEVGNMKPYMHLKSWDDLVARVETVEQKEGGELMIYFQLTTGERIRETSTICGQKFPQKLLRFYESNLRWRDTHLDK
jgi:hypothetical protein